MAYDPAYHRAYYLRNKVKKLKQAATWQKANLDKKRIHSKLFRAKLRKEVFAHYGRVCVCCGECDDAFLTIDHIAGGGTQHLSAIKTTLYQWLKANDFPKGFQTLCYNCNCAKRDRGMCPHKRLK